MIDKQNTGVIDQYRNVEVKDERGPHERIDVEEIDETNEPQTRFDEFKINRWQRPVCGGLERPETQCGDRRHEERLSSPRRAKVGLASRGPGCTACVVVRPRPGHGGDGVGTHKGLDGQ